MSELDECASRLRALLKEDAVCLNRRRSMREALDAEDREHDRIATQIRRVRRLLLVTAGDIDPPPEDDP